MITTIPISTVADYITQVDKALQIWGCASGYVWYRGVSRSSYKLIPSILRGNLDEDALIQDFLINYQAIHGKRVDDSWEMYALMQHYRLATRLLDWTKSPLVALYFALEQPDPHASRRAVWLMDPYALNKITCGYDVVVVPTKDRSRAPEGFEYWNHLPRSLRVPSWHEPIPQKPLAIEPPLANKRILYQQGCFTIHGCHAKPIESYFKGRNAPKLIKFTINGKRRHKKMLETLHNLGFKEDYIYQDLESLAKRLAREGAGS